MRAESNEYIVGGAPKTTCSECRRFLKLPFSLHLEFDFFTDAVYSAPEERKINPFWCGQANRKVSYANERLYRTSVLLPPERHG